MTPLPEIPRCAHLDSPQSCKPKSIPSPPCLLPDPPATTHLSTWPDLQSSGLVFILWPLLPSLSCKIVVAVVQSLSPVWLFVTPGTAARQTSLSFTISQLANSCPLSQWCYLSISSSVAPFSFCPQSFPASESFPMSWLFASDGQSIGVSASASVLLMNIQGWFPLGFALILIWDWFNLLPIRYFLLIALKRAKHMSWAVVLYFFHIWPGGNYITEPLAKKYLLQLPKGNLQWISHSYLGELWI